MKTPNIELILAFLTNPNPYDLPGVEVYDHLVGNITTAIRSIIEKYELVHEEIRTRQASINQIETARQRYSMFGMKIPKEERRLFHQRIKADSLLIQQSRAELRRLQLSLRESIEMEFPELTGRNIVCRGDKIGWNEIGSYFTFIPITASAA